MQSVYSPLPRIVKEITLARFEDFFAFTSISCIKSKVNLAPLVPLMNYIEFNEKCSIIVIHYYESKIF